MAQRLTVEIFGDDRSLQKAFTRASAAVGKFGRSMGQVGTAGLAKYRSELTNVAREEDKLFRLRSRRASSVGPFRVAGIGLGAGSALFAATQGVRALSREMEAAGAAALTTTGRFQNFGSALLTGDIVGGILSLRRGAESLDDLGISAKDATAAIGPLSALADDMGGKWRVIADEARMVSEAYREMAAETQAVLNASLGLRDAQNRLILGGPLGGRPGFQPKPQTLAERLAAAGFTPTKGVQRPIGPTARNAAAQTIAQAQEDLPEVLRLQRVERDRLTKAVANSHGNVEQREALNQQLAAARGAVIGTERQIRATSDAAAKVAKVAAEAARSDSWAKLIGALEIGVDRAELTRSLNDDLAKLNALKTGIEKQIRAGVDVAGAQSRLVAVTGQIASKQQEIAERAQEVAQARQFRALGLDVTGNKPIPGIENLLKQVSSLGDRIAGTKFDTGANRAMLNRIRKVLLDPLDKATEETREKSRDLLAAFRGGLDDVVKKGPLTKESALNTNKILEGLGLGRDLEKELKSRLSGFNTAGKALAGARSTPTGSFAGGGPIVVESHTTITMDDDVVGRAITRSQQRTRRRNPPQKRGPNRGGI